MQNKNKGYIIIYNCEPYYAVTVDFHDPSKVFQNCSTILSFRTTDFKGLAYIAINQTVSNFKMSD